MFFTRSIRDTLAFWAIQQLKEIVGLYDGNKAETNI